MKKLFFIFTVAIAMTACNNSQQKSTTDAKLEAFKDSMRMAADTAGLANYQAWKAQNELVNNKTTLNPDMQSASLAAPVTRSTSPARSTRSRSYSSSRNSGGSMSSESANTAKRKKGWSKAAKGTAIGAGTGAVLGAVINKKNRVAGGVVGGVLGGGVGYGIGRSMDKKDGRY